MPLHPNGDRLPPQANPIGQQLGLGQTFMPGAPSAWQLVQGTIAGTKALFLIFDTPVGKTCITLDCDGAVALADSLRENAGGITIPKIQLS
jgi:hypothetical protein